MNKSEKLDYNEQITIVLMSKKGLIQREAAKLLLGVNEDNFKNLEKSSKILNYKLVSYVNNRNNFIYHKAEKIKLGA